MAAGHRSLKTEILAQLSGERKQGSWGPWGTVNTSVIVNSPPWFAYTTLSAHKDGGVPHPPLCVSVVGVVKGEGLCCMCERAGVLKTAASRVAEAEALLRHPSFSHRKKSRPG